MFCSSDPLFGSPVGGQRIVIHVSTESMVTSRYISVGSHLHWMRVEIWELDPSHFDWRDPTLKSEIWNNVQSKLMFFNRTDPVLLQSQAQHCTAAREPPAPMETGRPELRRSFHALGRVKWRGGQLVDRPPWIRPWARTACDALQGAQRFEALRRS